MEDLKKNGGKKSTEGSSMLEFMKTKIKEYVDMSDESDIVYLRRILVSLDTYIINSKGGGEQ